MAVSSARDTPVPDEATLAMTKAIFSEPILNADPVYAACKWGLPMKKMSERNQEIVYLLAPVVFTASMYV